MDGFHLRYGDPVNENLLDFFKSGKTPLWWERFYSWTHRMKQARSASFGFKCPDDSFCQAGSYHSNFWSVWYVVNYLPHIGGIDNGLL